MVCNGVGLESQTHRNNCGEYRKTVITRSDKRHSNLILLIPHLEIKDFGPPASGGHGSYHCLTNVVNRLRNKCAMTSVGDMKENNFFDKVHSLFTTHNSLKRAGATHVALCESVGSYFRHWCGAFTLAEVLITLGIIGVVAAMTMQIIIPNIQDKQLTAMWKKKYSEISSIYFQVREEMGGGDICVESNSGGYANVIKCSKIKQWSGYGTLSPEFVEKFVAKLKVIDSCGFAEFGEAKKCQNFYVKWVGYCDWAANVGYYGTLIQNRGQKGSISSTYCMSPGGLYTAWDMNKKAVLLADGSVIYFGGYATGMISVDVNGFGKGPNVLGRDLFVVMVNEDWIRPIGADETFDKNANGDICKCSKDYGVERGQGILGSSNLLNGRVLSGACCSATKLYE